MEQSRASQTRNTNALPIDWPDLANRRYQYDQKQCVLCSDKADYVVIANPDYIDQEPRAAFRTENLLSVCSEYTPPEYQHEGNKTQTKH